MQYIYLQYGDKGARAALVHVSECPSSYTYCTQKFDFPLFVGGHLHIQLL